MNGKTPWDEDAERTTYRPVSGGQQPETASGHPPQSPVPPESPAPIPAVMADPLLAAATPLLQLLGRLAGLTRPPDLSMLREQVGREITLFEKKCRQQSVPMEFLRPAHYALCAALDDVVLHTPWAADSEWNERPLALTRYRDVHNDALFFDMLNQMRQEPAKFLPVLQLLYLCLSLGFLGQYRDDPQGLGRLREELSALIVRQRGATPASRTAIFDSIPRRFGAIPAWIPLLCAAAVIGGLFAIQSYELNSASDAVYAAAVNAPPAQMPPIERPAPAKPPAASSEGVSTEIMDRLRGALKNEIDGKLLAVSDSLSAPLLRIPMTAAFSPNSAQLSPGLVPALSRIGTVLKNQPVSIQVLGYTDNVPVRTVRFPSNYQLSQAQAQAVRAAILQGLGDAGRISAEGRGEADPIASNATSEGRERNRRIEIAINLDR